MPGALRLYLHYVRVSIRSQLQYRAAFVMTSVGVSAGHQCRGPRALYIAS